MRVKRVRVERQVKCKRHKWSINYPVPFGEKKCVICHIQKKI